MWVVLRSHKLRAPVCAFSLTGLSARVRGKPLDVACA